MPELSKNVIANHQIRETKCFICRERIFLDNTVRSKNGHKVPLNANGKPHNAYLTFLTRRAKSIKYTSQLKDFAILTQLLTALKEGEDS